MNLATILFFSLAPVDSTRITLSTAVQDNYFMCPVLTPKLEERLKEKCNCRVTKTVDYKVIISSDSLQLSTDEIRKIIDGVGFDTTHVNIYRNED
jgi:hypothetical protein